MRVFEGICASTEGLGEYSCPSRRCRRPVVRSYAIEEVVLPLPGHAVEYPRHGVGAAAYAAALADDGISEERLRAADCAELEVLCTEWCEQGLHAAVARL